MKKITHILSVSVCAAIMLSLTACGGGNLPETIGKGSDTSSESGETATVSKKSEGNSVQVQRLPEGAPELVMLDGNKATEDEIVKCEQSSDNPENYVYTVNTVFAYPSGTANGDKKPENNSFAVKLTEGSKWNDFTVTKAEAAYDFDNVRPSGVICQYLWLKGDITFNCKAHYGSTQWDSDIIILELSEEFSKQLPSLAPYASWGQDSDADICLAFHLYPESESSKKLAERLETAEEVDVTVSADEIKLQYTYFGLFTDGSTLGTLENITNYEIK